MRVIAMLLVLLAPAVAQEDVNKKAETGKYENKELGLKFSGIYGWDREAASGSGAWTKLVRYSDEDYDAEAILLVRNNPYGTSAELKDALAAEFKEGGEPAPGKPVYKSIKITEADMKRGNKLPGFDVEGIEVRVTEEGKKRERAIVVRTYFGKNRLFRVHCTVRRRRLKNVRDLFVRAAASLSVEAGSEKVARGIPFRSSRSGWNCAIPEGFVADLPPAGRNYEMQFIGQRGKVRIYIYAYGYQGTIEDQLADLTDYYGDTMKITKEEFKRYGGEAFDATITKGDRMTMVAAIVKGKRVYRVHTAGPKASEADLAAIHERFLKGFRLGR
ncbi:MAG: hypothetical protein ACYTHK_05350 [Planctomycetota bacterium]|jgi:hypothetical protein